MFRNYIKMSLMLLALAGISTQAQSLQIGYDEKLCQNADRPGASKCTHIMISSVYYKAGNQRIGSMTIAPFQEMSEQNPTTVGLTNTAKTDTLADLATKNPIQMLELQIKIGPVFGHFPIGCSYMIEVHQENEHLTIEQLINQVAPRGIRVQVVGGDMRCVVM